MYPQTTCVAPSTPGRPISAVRRHQSVAYAGTFEARPHLRQHCRPLPPRARQSIAQEPWRCTCRLSQRQYTVCPPAFQTPSGYLPAGWRATSKPSSRPMLGAVQPTAAAAATATGLTGPSGARVGMQQWRWLGYGMALALVLQYLVQWASHLPIWQRLMQRFIWWRHGGTGAGDPSPSLGTVNNTTTAMVLYSDNNESVEWINMCWRKAWRVYQKGLEGWIAGLLQPVFDNLIIEAHVPRLLKRLRILEFTLDHEAPYFSNMRRRTSRRDSDLNGVVDVRYTGGARMLLLLEVGSRHFRVKIPVLVSDLDLECKMWLKIRLAPMCPYFGTISLAFVGPPTIKVQLLPYNRVRLMRIPILQPLLTRLLTVDLPGLMVLPKRLEINIPPAVTSVAEAAVGHDIIMQAVASAVLQAEAVEHSLVAALPLGPQSAAGGVSLPDTFHGELQVVLVEARNLPVWGLPWQSNPWCTLRLGGQILRSRRDDDTSHAGSHRAPVWNQEFQLLVMDPSVQVLEIAVQDSQLTGRPAVGRVSVPLSRIPEDGRMTAWLPVQSSRRGVKSQGELNLQLVYKAYEDNEADAGYREAEAYAGLIQGKGITDIKSAAAASSRAAVAASAAMAAVAVTKAAAARAAARASATDKGSADNGLRSDDALQQRATVEAKAALAQNQDIDPQDLFPPVQYRIAEDDDVDMPYKVPDSDGKGSPGELQNIQAARRALKRFRSDLGSKRGADAVRVLQAQQKAGAEGLTSIDQQDSVTGSSDPESRGIGRGPTKIPNTDAAGSIDAEVDLDSAPGDDLAPEVMDAPSGKPGMRMTAPGSSTEPPHPAAHPVPLDLTSTAMGRSSAGPSSRGRSAASAEPGSKQPGKHRGLAQELDRRAVQKLQAELRSRTSGGGAGQRQLLSSAGPPQELPMDQLAAEVQAALQLKEEDAERLVKAAIARSEKPWLVLLSVASVLSAVLLGVLLLALRSQGGA